MRLKGLFLNWGLVASPSLIHDLYPTLANPFYNSIEPLFGGGGAVGPEAPQPEALRTPKAQEP